MKARLAQATRRLLVIPLVVLLIACGGAAAGSPSDVVQAASQAFAQGYGARDLTQFDAFFAAPAQGGDPQGLSLTKDAAHTLMNEAQPTETFEFRSFEVTSQQVDEQNNLATVHYRAEVTLAQNDQPVYAAKVEQDIALKRINGQWLIVGGDPPQTTPTLNVPTP